MTDFTSRQQTVVLPPLGSFLSRFIGLMERHGFVVLTGIGTIRAVYLEFIHLLRAFFNQSSGSKEACKGSVYFNERGIPMWHAGYEQCGRVREAFRMPASLASLPGRPWPCGRLREAWLRLLRLLQRVCHRALVLTLGGELAGALPPPATNPWRAMEAEGAEERPPADGERDGFVLAAGRESSHARPQESGDAWREDFSVSYALRYPNEFADPALEKEDLTVGEHVDPSLYVVEPCCGVEGLEIQDRRSGRWVPVEALCASLGGGGGSELGEAEGRELILFGGKALERATDGKVRGAPHRVRRGDNAPRHCFIYEQKYASFFPPPAMD